MSSTPAADAAIHPGLTFRAPAETLDLRPSPKALELREKLIAFMHEEVFPAEARYEHERGAAGPDDHDVPPVVEELKAQARARGLWNLCLLYTSDAADE